MFVIGQLMFVGLGCVESVKLGLLFRNRFIVALENSGADNKGRRG